VSAVGPQTPDFPEMAADPDALVMGVKPFSVAIGVVFDQFPDVDADVLLSAVEKVVDLIPSEVKDEMDAVGDVPVGDEASEDNLLRYLGKLRDAVSAYCSNEGATFLAGNFDPLVVSFAAADSRRIFRETLAEACATYEGTLADDLVDAVSLPVQEASHLTDAPSWLLTIMTMAVEFRAEHQIRAKLRPFQWRNRDAEFFDVFKTHHATKLAEFRASLPDVALGSLSPAEFARDWTTTTRGRLFQDTEAVHPAGSPVPGRVPIRNAPDTPDPMRVDTGVASPKWLRINLGGASSVGSPIGRTGPALTHPAQVSTVAQLQDSVFVAGEYQTVEGRVVRASDFRWSQ
jgi:hypothetical protein